MHKTGQRERERDEPTTAPMRMGTSCSLGQEECRSISEPTKASSCSVSPVVEECRGVVLSMRAVWLRARMVVCSVLQLTPPPDLLTRLVDQRRVGRVVVAAGRRTAAAGEVIIAELGELRDELTFR